MCDPTQGVYPDIRIIIFNALDGGEANSCQHGKLVLRHVWFLLSTQPLDPHANGLRPVSYQRRKGQRSPVSH